MKRHLLVVLTLAIVLPPFAILIIAGAGLVAHERAMREVAHSYVLDLGQSVADRLTSGRAMSRLFMMPNIGMMSPFRWGLSLPGWVAIVNDEGQVLLSSSGVDVDLPRGWRSAIPLGEAVELKGRKGDTFTIAAIPMSESGLYVIAAVSWAQLLGPMLRFSRLWPVLVAITGLAGVLAVLLLWRRLIAPLRALETEVGSLRWGWDLPKEDDPRSIYELQRLRQVLHQLAQSAIERMELTRRYVTDLVRVQEEEQERVAREIHDGPLQGVTALMQQIRLAERSGSEAELKSHLAIAEKEADITVRELRALCDSLSPPWLDLGLKEALAELADRLSRSLGLEISVEMTEGCDLPRETVLALFRVAQEAINNAARHGRAKHVLLRGFVEDDELVMEVSDDGCGFNPTDDVELLRVKGHRGMANMKERVALIGGKFEVKSRPDKGTSVICRIPLACNVSR